MGKGRWSLNLLGRPCTEQDRVPSLPVVSQAANIVAHQLRISSSSIAIPIENYRASVTTMLQGVYDAEEMGGRWYVLSVCKSIEN